MKRFIIVILLAIVTSTTLWQARAASKANPIRLLLLDGQSGGPYHDWQLTTAVMKKELQDAGIFSVTVATSPKFGEDFSNFKPEFSKYQAIVLNYDAPDWPADLREQLENYVKNGGGLVIVHASDNSFPDWVAYNQMIGIGGWRNRTEKAGPMWYFKDGKLVSDNVPGPAGEHGNRLPFQVETRAPEHPIMKGLPHVWMHGADELYGTLRGPGQNMTVLATAHSDPANHGTGHDEPMLMVLSYGKGRIFHTTMGHDVAALSCAGFITTFQRGAEWVATGRVTQKVPADFPTAGSESLRVDIAKMDPDFVKGPPPRPDPFETLAYPALFAMKKRADELGIGGVAVVAYFQGDKIQAWSSKMLVIGRMRDEPSDTNKGANLIGIAYAKAVEMADTLKDSGSQVRPAMTGEFGWQGGVIVRGKTGYLIAAFSGGKSEDDVKVSRAGVEQLATGL
ncbi:MAG TPA: ThuA domain-containing protein [Candidatus Acidoferrum sp.]|nr:ThuA domain-containing protein [Candidatus Acidoferrum sp.]